MAAVLGMHDVKGGCDASLIEHQGEVSRTQRRSRLRPILLAITAFSTFLAAIIVTFTSGVTLTLTISEFYSRCTSQAHQLLLAESPSSHVNHTLAPRATIWQPAVGSKFDYRLLNSDINNIAGFNVLFVDLFDVAASDITKLHAKGVKAVCYFSAGTAENWRSDYSSFTKTDLGNSVDGWAGEKYVDIRTANVKNIMLKRLDLAKTKKCDGVDPDNVDSYTNSNGKSLTAANAITYVNFLADMAHARGLSIGLKNAPGLISSTLSRMQWSVQEECHDDGQCSLYQPFIKNGKPCYNVEYPKGDTSNSNSISAAKLAKYCGDKTSTGFSIVMKNLDLDDWIQKC